MRALSTKVTELFEQSKVIGAGHVLMHQYARLASGAWAYRNRSGLRQHRSALSFGKWRAAEGDPDLTGFEKVEIS